MTTHRQVLYAVTAILGSFLFWAAVSNAHAAPRVPRGIYVAVDVSDYITHAGLPSEGADGAMVAFYDSLLDNPAVAGLHLEVHWDWAQPQPFPARPNWGYIDDAFFEAAAHGKAIQLDVTAGFNSPQWVWDATQPTGIPSCDPLFANPPAAAPNCGTVTFNWYGENTDQDGNHETLVLPLPWNGEYVGRWHAFLLALALRYGSNPALASVTMAGPTAGSPEMIMPNNFNTCPNNVPGPCVQKNGWLAEDMWNVLFQKTSPNPHRPYATNADDAFIEQWIATIDFYETLFQNVTLIITPGAGTGFPSFNSGYPFPPSPGNVLYHPECDYSDTGGHTYAAGNDQTRSCDAATTILSYFMRTLGGFRGDGMGSQTSGMEAQDPTALGDFTPGGNTGDVGVPGIKYLSQYSLTPRLPQREVIGGAQFDHAFTGNTTEQEGCPQGSNGCPNITPEQAAYNVLQTFFRQTPGAFSFGGASLIGNLSTPRYLEVFYQDVVYAQTPTSCAQPINDVETGTSFQASAQDLLNAAAATLSGQNVGYPPPHRGPC